MPEPTPGRIERELEEGQRDSRRLLSRYYLAEIDRLNEEFLGNPDARSNSSLREGEISHADVNAVIRCAEKTVIFGQQTRLRAGILMKEDERLPRFHAGHDLVHYFYGAIRLIPEYLLDAIFERGISVTMVKDRDLLVYRGPRCHQSFHTGRTRRTIYIPEGVLTTAFERGYHSWAFSVILLHEAWKLLGSSAKGDNRPDQYRRDASQGHPRRRRASPQSHDDQLAHFPGPAVVSAVFAGEAGEGDTH